MATEPASPGRPPVPVSEHVRVLLVDDDETTAILVRSLLGKLKRAATPSSGEGRPDGLSALLGERWDACLADYRIGDESGFDVLRTALLRNVTTPMIMFTRGRRRRRSGDGAGRRRRLPSQGKPTPSRSRAPSLAISASAC